MKRVTINMNSLQKLHLKCLDVFTHCLMQIRGTWSALTRLQMHYLTFQNIKHSILIFKIILKTY